MRAPHAGVGGCGLLCSECALKGQLQPTCGAPLDSKGALLLISGHCQPLFGGLPYEQLRMCMSMCHCCWLEQTCDAVQDLKPRSAAEQHMGLLGELCSTHLTAQIVCPQ
jgi:hypothetical protein